MVEIAPISDPRKNDIFICYSGKDIEFVKKLDAAIRAQNRDPWIDWDDIPIRVESPVEQEHYIQTGVRDADTFVFVVSPDAIADDYNLKALQLAVQLNKQLIALVWREAEGVPQQLETAVWLAVQIQDAADNLYQLARSIVHIQIHARLRTSADKWQASNRHEEHLLRGRDLVAVSRWMKHNANKEPKFTPLQEDYVNTSATASSVRPEPTDAFISYSRRDKAFAEKLCKSLSDRDMNLWVDWENIPIATDWWEEIEEGIETAYTFLFIVSPDSICSIHCHAEIAHAIKHNKRIICIIWRPVSDATWTEVFDEDREVCIKGKPVLLERDQKINLRQVGEVLRQYQWYEVRQHETLETICQKIFDAVRTDQDYVKKHTRLLLRAIEWDEQKRSYDLLLQGRELQAAKQLLYDGHRKEPRPTHLQAQYIAASNRERSRRRTRRILWIALGAAIVSAATMTKLLADRQSVSTLVASLEDKQELDALLDAVEVGRRLKESRWIEHFLPNLQVRGVTALQQEIYNLREINRLEKHTGTVYNVSFSPDMQQIASASEDRSVGLWSIDGQLIKSLTGHQKEVVSITYDPAGRVLASGSRDGTVKLWTPQSGALLKTLTLPRTTQTEVSEVISVVFSPGGQTLATAYKDGTVTLWTPDPSRGWQFATRFATLKHPAGRAITSVSFSRYGDRIATSSLDGTIKLWTAQGQPIATTMQHDSGVLSVSFSPDDQAIASADVQGTLKLWTRDGELIRPIAAHEGIIHRVVFSPRDGSTIASVGADGAIKLWDRENGKLRHALRGHQAAVYRVQFSHDGRTLASAGADDTVKLWSVHDGTLLDTFEAHRDEVLDIDFSSDVNTPILVSASRDRSVRLWQLASPVTILPHNNRVFDVSFSPDGKAVASSSSNSIRLWQPSGIPLNSVRVRGDVLSLSFSRYGKVLASGGSDDAIKLWQFNGSRITNPHVIPSQQGDVFSLDFSPEGQLLASAGEYGTVKLWRFDGKQATLLQTLSGHRGSVLTVRFAPDNGLLASAGTDGIIKLWRFDGTLVRSIAAEQGKVNSLAFRFDGVLASAGEYGSIKLWRPDGTLLKALEGRDGHSDQVLRASFSHDGKLLASAGRDGTIKLWTHQGELVTTLRRHKRDVAGAAFDPAGTKLASASFDNRVLLWDVPDEFSEQALNQLLQQGCDATRNYLNGLNSEKAEPNLKTIRSFCSKSFPIEPEKQEPSSTKSLP